MLSEELDTLQAIYLHELQVIKDDGYLLALHYLCLRCLHTCVLNVEFKLWFVSAREKVRINLSPATAEKAEEQFVFMTLEFVIPEKVWVELYTSL